MSELTYAGQHQLDAVDILQSGGISIDIKDHVDQLTIYEDLFAPFISGNIVVSDTLDIPNMLMQQGDDMLRIKVYTPGLPTKFYIEQYFHIYKISDRAEVGDRRLSYIIHFASVDMYTDTKVDLSKTYKEKPHVLVGSILKDELKTTREYSFDPTTNTVQYTSNFWSPTKNIVYLTNHAKGEDGFPSYVFYENRFGYQFRSLTKMAAKDKKPYQTFITNDYTAEVAAAGENSNGDVSKNLKKDYELILEITQPFYFDYYSDLAKGMFNTRLQYYDLVTKRRKDVTFSMSQDDHELMNDNRMYKTRVADNSFVQKGSVNLAGQTHYAVYNGTQDVTDIKYKQQRVSVMHQLQQQSLQITVLGRTDYTVGMKVHVDANKMRRFESGSSAKEIQDNLITGYYIVGALCHRFMRDKHICSMDLISDSIVEGK